MFGPQVRVNLPELRRRIPKRYPIRFYPDITHSITSEFSVNDWDVAYAMTEEREVINPRPIDEAHIFRILQPYADAGFLTYSEGCNDDVNKFVWSALGWDPDVDITTALRDFGRYFIGPDMADDFAQGLLALERNWRGPLLANTGVDVTLAQFQAMEGRATPQQKLNWRFQEALYRAHYDAYVRTRLLDETDRERRALEFLKAGNSDAARRELTPEPQAKPGAALRARVFELAEALFQSIHMQLSVPRYAAISAGRGANLDLIDRPITNAPFILAHLNEPNVILNWTNPGPGGFYDDLGDPMNRPHLDPGVGFEKDPAFAHTIRTDFGSSRRDGLRISWRRHADALYGNSLKLHYNGLDPAARYRVRYIQPNEAGTRATRLVANDKWEIRPMQRGEAEKPLEFDIPADATTGGKLTLEWQANPEEAGNGRFVQVSEVWLLRVPSAIIGK